MEKGTLFRHYYCITKIGQGSMCQINLAFDTRAKRFVAIKTLHEHHATVPTFIKRMHREAECYRNLGHKNIVGFHDADFEGEEKFVAMDYLRGDTLTQRLRNEGGSLFLHDAVRILEDIAEALHWADKNGVVHRDIKTDNIMVDTDGNAKLFDFGIAYADDQMLQTRMGDIKLVGLYASPEQVMGGKLDHRSDLYSLGLVFFEMLTGRKLHLCKTMEQFMQIFQAPVPPPSSKDSIIPTSIDAICLKLLQNRPEDRYQSARDLLIDTGNLRINSTPEEIERLFGKEADLLFEKAKRAFEDGDNKTAIGICQQIEEQDVHRKASMYQLLARAAEAMKRPDISIRYLEKAAFLKSKDFSFALDYFCELMKRNELGRAKELVKRSYPKRLDQEITTALQDMLGKWEEPEFVELRKVPEEEPQGFFDKMKSLFSS